MSRQRCTTAFYIRNGTQKISPQQVHVPFSTVGITSALPYGPVLKLEKSLNARTITVHFSLTAQVTSTGKSKISILFAHKRRNMVFFVGRGT